MSQHIFPNLSYTDAHAAFDWLEKAFGVERVNVYEDDHGRVQHAELRFRDTFFMAGSEGAGSPEFQGHTGQGFLYCVAEDVDALFERAKREGAEIVTEPRDQEYGSRDFSCRDPEGNLWSFGTYTPEQAG
jgi:uncharacterized glyoxalase superfamily protein PhnB